MTTNTNSTVTKIADKQWTFDGTEQTFTTKKDAVVAEKETMTDDTSKAVTDAMDEVLNAAEEETAPAPKKKAKKPSAAKKDAKQTPEKEETTKEEPEEKKPEPVTYEGYKVAEGVNPEDVAELEKAANESVQAIESKDDTLVEVYVTLGRALNNINSMFASTKDAGKFRKAKMPGTEEMDASLRSCCTWLYKALYRVDEETSDILQVLGLDTNKNDPISALRDYKTKNPVVIKRHYKAAKKEQEKAAKLDELGVTEEQLEEQEKEEQEKAKQEKADQLAALEEQIIAYLMKKKSKQEIANEAASLMLDAAEKKGEDALAYLRSMT